jgi:aminoglycoside phosphotransferase (APT) family kinase protein
VLSAHEGSHVDSDASAQVTAAIRQDPAVFRALDAIRDTWQCDTLMHGDLKWDNCIVFLSPMSKLDLRVVDWEMATHGDSAWDVGSIIQSYWSHAILRALPGTDSAAPTLIEHAVESLHVMRPAVVALWNAYRRMRGFDGGATQDFLDRCLRCAAARMIQTTYEYVGARGQVIPRASAILQAGFDILKNSTYSAAWSFGLEAELE